jgi:hypothetical protein
MKTPTVPATILFRLLFSFLLFPFSLSLSAQPAGAEWEKIYSARQFVLYATPSDSAEAARLAPIVEEGVGRAAEFFGHPFPQTFEVYIFPDRAALDRQWQQAWADTSFHSQCWMVASGMGSRLDVLSPRTWAEQACEHRAADSVALARLLVHELIHVYHGQHHAVPDFTGLDDLAWWIEGIATFASGQLDENRRTGLRKLISEGKAPRQLAEFWSGRHRYGLAGSMAAYVDERLGRSGLFELLKAGSTAEALKKLETTEPGLIAAWEKYCLEKL